MLSGKLLPFKIVSSFSVCLVVEAVVVIAVEVVEEVVVHISSSSGILFKWFPLSVFA